MSPSLVYSNMLSHFSAIYSDTSVVVDGNMITSRLPKDLPDFCKAIIAQLR